MANLSGADLNAAVLAEREAGANYAEEWAARFDRLLTAGGNPVIGTDTARQMRRYFTAFAQDLRAGLHVPDEQGASDDRD